MTCDSTAMARLERRLGWLLTAGVAASAVLLALGVVAVLLSPGGAQGRGLLATGLIILMATPMLRVVVSLAEYVRMREWSFVMTTLVVLAELAIGVIYALRRQ